MPRDDALYVGHMLDTARKAIEKVERKSRTDFDADETLRLALAYLIQIVGEAASRVSPAFREVHAGFRGLRSSVCVTRSSTTTSEWITTSFGRSSRQTSPRWPASWRGSDSRSPIPVAALSSHLRM